MKTIITTLLGLASAALLASCTTVGQKESASHTTRATSARTSVGGPAYSGLATGSIPTY